MAQPSDFIVNGGPPTTCPGGNPTSLTIVNSDNTANTITFSGTAGYPVQANLNDGDDTFTVVGGTQAVSVDGGNGDDRITGGPGADALSGGAGDDLLRPGLGGGTNIGGTHGTAGGLNGASGDIVTYDNVTGDVAADISVDPGSATAPGLTQSLSQVENLTGGSGDDTLTGNTGAEPCSTAGTATTR